MGKKLAAAIHLTEGGVVHSFLPGTTPPAWAAERITNPKAWAETTPAVGVPPKSGKGSGVTAWREYAAEHGLDAGDDASRDEIIAALEANGVPTER